MLYLTPTEHIEIVKSIGDDFYVRHHCCCSNVSVLLPVFAVFFNGLWWLIFFLCGLWRKRIPIRNTCVFVNIGIVFVDRCEQVCPRTHCKYTPSANSKEIQDIRIYLLIRNNYSSEFFNRLYWLQVQFDRL